LLQNKKEYMTASGENILIKTIPKTAKENPYPHHYRHGFWLIGPSVVTIKVIEFLSNTF